MHKALRQNPFCISASFVQLPVSKSHFTAELFLLKTLKSIRFDCIVDLLSITNDELVVIRFNISKHTLVNIIIMPRNFENNYSSFMKIYMIVRHKLTRACTKRCYYYDVEVEAYDQYQ